MNAARTFAIPEATPCWRLTRHGWRRFTLAIYVDGTLVATRPSTSRRAARREVLAWRLGVTA